MTVQAQGGLTDRTARIRRAFALSIALGIACSILAASPATTSFVSVIVRASDGGTERADDAVERAGGTVAGRIGIIDGVVARVPSTAIDGLRGAPGVLSVSLNGRVQLLGAPKAGYDPTTDAGSMYSIAQRVTGAPSFWSKGITGKGIDVALIDSGVAPVTGLSDPNKVVFGPDFSVESQAPNLRNIDAFGHGTHMAGIIAGRDTTAAVVAGNASRFLGIAPDARIVSVKVADSEGWTDVSQVIAGIDWVVNHRTSNGMNVKVLNLSFGTYGLQSYLIDPLAYAAEVAWRKGIVVVASSGNRGDMAPGMTNPAIDPYVVAVGAYADTGGQYGTTDASVPSWSSKGDLTRSPDLVAPGKSVASLRVPNSNIDLLYPSARVDTRYFRGSGTSQAAAVVSGAAALLLQQRPTISPDQLKALLKGSATKLPNTAANAQGSGALDLKNAYAKATPSALLSKQLWAPATGLGSLEAARGSIHLLDGTVELNGERDLFGVAWNAGTWATNLLNGVSWVGDVWRGIGWASPVWTAADFAGRSWSGRSWSDNTWDGRSWSGRSWSGRSWSGRSWSGRSWSSEGWSATSWS